MFGIFGFLGFLLILVLFIIFIALAFLGNIVRSIFGLGRKAPKQYYNQTNASNKTDNSYTSHEETSTSPANGKKKIFADDEGEYVEFEEVN